MTVPAPGAIHYRTAHVAEAPAVLDLWRGADAEPTRTDNVPCVQALIRHDPGALILALDGDEIVGSIIAAWDGWRGSIYRLVVAKSARRAGTGTELLRRAERRLESLGVRRAQALVVAGNDEASGYWRASGWEPETGWLRFVYPAAPTAR